MQRSGDPKRREERVKLIATALNNLGVFSIGAGLISPTFLGTIDPAFAIGGVVVGFALHLAGLGVLQFVVADEPEPEDV